LNTQEYIASGILEQYVLGSVTDQERREVECLSSIYPEIKLELNQLADASEQYARLHQMRPPEFLKEQIFSKLNFTENKPEVVAAPTFEIETPSKVRSLWPTGIAAAVVVSCLAFLYFLNKSSQDQINAKTLELAQSTSLLKRYQDTKNKVVVLAGTEKFKDAKATVFWNAETKNVEVLAHSLPLVAADKQFQLWVLKDGKPIDMGVFSADNEGVVAKLKSTDAGEAFAITIEKAGGSPSPTLEEMVVFGKILAE
jgi:anti-sigma-K factor RskA